MRTLARTRFDNESKVPKIEAPILIAHSPDDSIIPFAHGRALFAAANEPKSFFEFRGDHNEGFWLGGTSYTSGIEEFLDQYLPPSTEQAAP